MYYFKRIGNYLSQCAFNISSSRTNRSDIKLFRKSENVNGIFDEIGENKHLHLLFFKKSFPKNLSNLRIFQLGVKNLSPVQHSLIVSELWWQIGVLSATHLPQVYKKHKHTGTCPFFLERKLY